MNWSFTNPTDCCASNTTIQGMIKSNPRRSFAIKHQSPITRMDVSSIIRFNFLLLFFSKFSLDQREIETELFFGLRSAVIRACLSTRRKRNDDCVCQGVGRASTRARKRWRRGHRGKWRDRKEVAGMKRMDWFSPERAKRNWYRQRMMDYRATTPRRLAPVFRFPLICRPLWFARVHPSSCINTISILWQRLRATRSHPFRTTVICDVARLHASFEWPLFLSFRPPLFFLVNFIGNSILSRGCESILFMVKPP